MSAVCKKNVGILCDIGNSAAKIALANKARLLAEWLIPHGDKPALQKTIAELQELSPEPMDYILAASVAPSRNDLIMPELEKASGIATTYVNAAEIPLVNHYEKPAELGIDRLLAAYAARSLFPDTPGIVAVDCGTAITFDCVAQNEYLGGLIFPGPTLASQALATRTERLPLIDFFPLPTGLAPARNTVEGIRNGLIFGYAALVNGLCENLKNFLQMPTLVVGTGGFGRILLEFCPVMDEFYPDLVLRGLWLLEYYSQGR